MAGYRKIQRDKDKWVPDLKKISYLSSLGFTEKQIASALNVDYAVFRYHRTLEDSPVNQAMEEGLNSTIEKATKKLIEKIEEGNLDAVKYFLNKKGGWEDSQSVQGQVKPSNFTVKRIS